MKKKNASKEGCQKGCLKNAHIFYHNGFINVDKKYLGNFLSKK